MKWWQFCERARCFPDTALSLYHPRELAARYARYNPDDEPWTARDVLLLAQGDALVEASREVAPRQGSTPGPDTISH